MLDKKNFDLSDDILFGISLRSISGVNITVGNKNYNMILDNNGSFLIKEFIPEFELTEEEFKKFQK